MSKLQFIVIERTSIKNDMLANLMEVRFIFVGTSNLHVSCFKPDTSMCKLFYFGQQTTDWLSGDRRTFHFLQMVLLRFSGRNLPAIKYAVLACPDLCCFECMQICGLLIECLHK